MCVCREDVQGRQDPREASPNFVSLSVSSDSLRLLLTRLLALCRRGKCLLSPPLSSLSPAQLVLFSIHATYNNTKTAENTKRQPDRLI